MAVSRLDGLNPARCAIAFSGVLVRSSNLESRWPRNARYGAPRSLLHDICRPGWGFVLVDRKTAARSMVRDRRACNDVRSRVRRSIRSLPSRKKWSPRSIFVVTDGEVRQRVRVCLDIRIARRAVSCAMDLRQKPMSLDIPQ
jgi:hypothetical protein